MSTSDNIVKMTNDVAKVVSHPNFLKMMEQMNSLPAAERQSEAEEIAKLGTLVKYGIQIPHGLRVSLRSFEDPNTVPTTRAIPRPGADIKPITVCVSAGLIVCVSVGGDVS